MQVSNDCQLQLYQSIEKLSMSIYNVVKKQKEFLLSNEDFYTTNKSVELLRYSVNKTNLSYFEKYKSLRDKFSIFHTSSLSHDLLDTAYLLNNYD